MTASPICYAVAALWFLGALPGNSHAATNPDTPICSPPMSYPQALGIQTLDDKEHQRIKANVWRQGDILYLDLYNGNPALTLSAIDIQLIPDDPADNPGPKLLEGNAIPLNDPQCQDTSGYYRDQVYRVPLTLPPNTATHQHVRVAGLSPSTRFTWRILRVEGYPTPKPPSWYLWR